MRCLLQNRLKNWARQLKSQGAHTDKVAKDVIGFVGIDGNGIPDMTIAQKIVWGSQKEDPSSHPSNLQVCEG
jgi:hypothetical protein